MSYTIPLLVLLCLCIMYIAYTIDYGRKQCLLFVDGFWSYDKDDINIILYFDNAQHTGTMMVSKKGLVKSEFPFDYTLIHKRGNKYSINITVSDNYSKYAKLLSNDTDYMDIYINEGKLILYNDNETILTLLKDNQMNDLMLDYVMS